MSIIPRSGIVLQNHLHWQVDAVGYKVTVPAAVVKATIANTKSAHCCQYELDAGFL